MTNQRAFTLIELAIVLVLVGLVTSAGLLLFPRIWHEKQRAETQKYLLASKSALLAFAATYNALPAPLAGPILPAESLKLRDRDDFDGALRYFVNPAMLANTTACSTIKLFFSDADTRNNWAPRLWQQGMPLDGSGIPVAVVLISRGANGALDINWIDDDGDGLVDAGETIVGDNTQTAPSATTNFVQAPESGGFDDITVTISLPELFAALPDCQP